MGICALKYKYKKKIPKMHSQFKIAHSNVQQWQSAEMWVSNKNNLLAVCTNSKVQGEEYHPASKSWVEQEEDPADNIHFIDIVNLRLKCKDQFICSQTIHSSFKVRQEKKGQCRLEQWAGLYCMPKPYCKTMCKPNLHPNHNLTNTMNNPNHNPNRNYA